MNDTVTQKLSPRQPARGVAGHCAGTTARDRRRRPEPARPGARYRRITNSPLPALCRQGRIAGRHGHARLPRAAGALRQAEQSAGDCPQDQLVAFAHAYVDFAASNPQLFKLMFGPAVQPAAKYPELREASRDTLQLVQEILQRGIERACSSFTMI